MCVYTHQIVIATTVSNTKHIDADTSSFLLIKNAARLSCLFDKVSKFYKGSYQLVYMLAIGAESEDHALSYELPLIEHLLTSAFFQAYSMSVANSCSLTKDGQ